MFHAGCVCVQRKNLTPFAEQVNEVSSVAAPCVEHAHTSGDVTAQNLIENVDIDLPELLLHGHRHDASLPGCCGNPRTADRVCARAKPIPREEMRFWRELLDR